MKSTKYSSQYIVHTGARTNQTYLKQQVSEQGASQYKQNYHATRILNTTVVAELRTYRNLEKKYKTQKSQGKLIQLTAAHLTTKLN